MLKYVVVLFVTCILVVVCYGFIPVTEPTHLVHGSVSSNKYVTDELSKVWFMVKSENIELETAVEMISVIVNSENDKWPRQIMYQWGYEELPHESKLFKRIEELYSR